mmetsp:Transcript_2129/g.4748  ORF Transcript_2129/g.4748 Transcript_2129/m.4748 type:complete len:99 (-) Transcript_2129:223-519(-)
MNRLSSLALFALTGKVGAVYGTASKPDAGDAIGIQELASIVAATKLPAVAIGGIQPVHVKDCIEAGADGVAVISAILGAENPKARAAALAREVQTAQQ